MTRLSSKATFFYKRIFPVVWFGILVAVPAIALLNGASVGEDPLVLVVPAAMMGFGYFLIKRLVFDLVDEVMDR